MALEDDFKSATDRVKSLSSRPGNADLLELYALFKQSSSGDVTGSKPSRFKFEARAKFTAWEGKRGTSKEDAMNAYIALVSKLGG